ncbi:MAG TPA: hypothetical protein VGG77_11110 [Roseiarcus sp.]
MAVSPPSIDKPRKDARAAHRRARLIRLRENQLRAERQQAINNPDAAEVKSAAVSVRDYRVASGLSNASVFRRIKDGRIKSVKLHGRRLIAYSEIERLRHGEARAQVVPAKLRAGE